jgi:flagellar biogenesis protein FliO
MSAETIISTLSYFVSAFTWSNMFLTLAFIFAIYLLYRLNKDDARFDIADLFIDQGTQKASGSQIIVLSMAILSGWVVVTLTSRDKPVETILLGVLGIFVAGRTITSVFGKTPPDTVTTTQTVVQQQPPPAPPGPPLPTIGG